MGAGSGGFQQGVPGLILGNLTGVSQTDNSYDVLQGVSAVIADWYGNPTSNEQFQIFLNDSNLHDYFITGVILEAPYDLTIPFNGANFVISIQGNAIFIGDFYNITTDGYLTEEFATYLIDPGRFIAGTYKAVSPGSSIELTFNEYSESGAIRVIIMGFRRTSIDDFI